MEVAVHQPAQQFVELRDSSHAGEARRLAVHCAEKSGFNETERGAIAIAVTELATNIVKHAGSGTIVCGNIAQNGNAGLRVLALDKGPGIPDLGRALEDGYSTSGTAGNGFGAVQRLSTRFEVYSRPQRGTCVLAEFSSKGTAPDLGLQFQVGAVSLAMRRESVCGDGWRSRPCNGTHLFMLVDGLGHGPYAADAAREAERVLDQSQSLSPATILQDCHDALRKTRGASAAIAAISREKKLVSFAGVGNISGTLITANSRRGMASHNGTLGHQLYKVQEFAFPWDRESVLIMHSDGLRSRWDLNEYPGILAKHASVIAAVLYRDFERERDDVTVLVAKNSE
jgi:anti-sigma regulatory factor (Ser/Thr protein kinase)